MVVTQHQSGFLRCFPNALKLFPQTGATSQQIRFYIIPFKLLCPVIPLRVATYSVQRSTDNRRNTDLK